MEADSNLQMATNNTEDTNPSLVKTRRIWLFVVGMVVILFLIWFFVFPPITTPHEVRITIPEGATARQTGRILDDAGVVRSGQIYTLLATILKNYGYVQSGEYKFTRSYTVFHVVARTLRGQYGGTQARVTFPEGITVNEMATILVSQITDFKTDQFLQIAKPLEGKLFPNTYFFFESTPPDQIIKRIQAQYEKIVKPLFLEDPSGHTEDEIITMASILEREARTSDEAGIISGVLWKRLSKGIPLQVDATFLYTIHKGSSELTTADLHRDEPYNTYVHKGLPPGPIGNPGLAMIRAALNPVASPYYYYLHDPNGHIHFAKTYEEHLANKRKYLH